MLQKLLRSDKVRFLVVGSFNTALDFILLNCFVVLFHLPVLGANILSVTVGIIISYILNHHFVFRSDEKLSFKKFLSFFVVSGFSSLILQSLVIWSVEQVTGSQFGRSLLLLNYLNQHPQIELNVAKAAAVGVGMVWNFIAYKYVIFKKSTEKSVLELERQAEDEL